MDDELLRYYYSVDIVALRERIAHYYERNIAANMSQHHEMVSRGEYVRPDSVGARVKELLIELEHQEYLPLIWVNGMDDCFEPITLEKHLQRVFMNSTPIAGFNAAVKRFHDLFKEELGGIIKILQKESFTQKEQLRNERKNWKRN